MLTFTRQCFDSLNNQFDSLTRFGHSVCPTLFELNRFDPVRTRPTLFELNRFDPVRTRPTQNLRPEINKRVPVFRSLLVRDRWTCLSPLRRPRPPPAQRTDVPLKRPELEASILFVLSTSSLFLSPRGCPRGVSFGETFDFGP